MATLLHSESRRLYSWWWDSHISPKNSKWLQDNLTDMDAKVKAMIKLIEEDADSFARRAEMYYKKRPELMKLVEEFYRAYRALAERYDHATVELRQAHRTMAEAFPNQLSYAPGDDSPSGSFGPDGEPHTQEMPHPMCAFIDPDCLPRDSFGLSLRSNRGYPEESDSGINKKGLKQLDELFMSREAASQVSKVADRKMKKGLKVHEVAEGDTGRQAETEVQILKKALSEIQTEKEAALLQYQQSLQKLSSLERELKDVGGLDERASRAEIEIKILKETLAKLEAERDAGLLQYNKCLKRISALENVISQTEEDSKGLNQRATKAEIESQQLKQELSALEAEKEAGLLQYNQCLQLLSSLQKKIFIAEENSRMLNELTERAETEAKALEQALAKLKQEKDAAELQYELCMEKIAMMESEISHAQEDVNRLNSEIVTGAAKLKTVEEQCFLLRRSNHSLQSEAENLAQEIAKKDQELSEKENELEKLQVLLQDEQSRFIQVEANLQTLQKLHSQSQEEQKALAFELQNSLQILKDLEISNHDLQENLQQVKEENQNLKELNRNSVISITDLRNEICSLKEIKEKLEEDVSLQVAQSNSLQQEICRLKQEIECSNTRYWALMEQVDLLGLSPESLGSSVKNLQDENLKLKEVCRKDSEEKEVLHEKLRAMDELMEKNVALESSLSDLNRMLEGSREKVKELQESSQFLQGEKSSLVAEKSILLSQLQIMTENVQKLLEKSALLENSLSGANIELEGLRTRSRSLEELCQTLKYDKSNLQDERSSLVSQLKNVEERLGNLERRFTRLEEKYTGLEKEKDSTLCQVKGLWGLLGVEKQERSCYIQSSESRLEYLENQVHQLQEESRFSKKDFEEELDKSVNAQVEIFILQKFIKDLEEKNLSLLIECQKHVEASKLSNNLISELETENLEQQVEVEFLLDEIERLRMGVRQVLRALQFDPVNEHEDGSLAHILDNIEDLKSLALVNEAEKQQLVVENSVLLTLLEQLRLDCVELKSGKSMVEQEFKIMAEQHAMLETSSHELLEINRQLRLEVNKGEQQEKELKAQLETRLVNLTSLQGSYLQLKEENLKALGENRSLLQKVLDLKEETRVLEEENSSILLEAVAVGNISSVFESFATQKIKELEALSEDISSLNVINRDLKQKVELLGYKLQTKEAESLRLNKKIEKLQQELQEEEDLTGQLNCQILIETDFLQEKATELFLAEQNIKATNNLNAEFCITIEELKRQCEESKMARDIMEKRVLELSQVCTDQKIEIECLHEAKDKMESEVATLHEEIEERRTREDSLSLELQGRSTDSEIWEAEASSFYFDLQISSIHEVLLQNKVHELTAFCGSLEVENATKDIEIEKMKEGFGILEGEIQRMKAHLSAYVPVINSLRENIEYLEHNALRTSQGKTGVETTSQLHEKSPEELINDESIAETDGISDLLEMKCRLKVVGEAVIKEMDRLAAEKAVVKKMDKLKMPEMRSTEKPLIKGAERLQLRCRSAAEKDVRKEEAELANEPADASKPQNNKPEVSEVRNGVLMKDIPLDEVSECSLYRRSKREHPRKDNQMLGLWESAERDCLNPIADKQNHEAPLLKNSTARRQSENAKPENAIRKSQDRSLELQIEKEVGIDKLEVSTSITTESNQEGKSLERLASDAQKLISLQTTVQDLKTKMESGKRSKRANDLEFERVKKQLQEVEEAIQQMVDADDQLTKDVEESPSNLEGNGSVKVEEQDSMRRKRVAEEARKRSEKIRRLQFDVQSIQYILLKLEDEKKSKSKRTFSGSRTGILLRDFIYRSGRRSSRRQRKGCFCGCARSSTKED